MPLAHLSTRPVPTRSRSPSRWTPPEARTRPSTCAAAGRSASASCPASAQRLPRARLRAGARRPAVRPGPWSRPASSPFRSPGSSSCSASPTWTSPGNTSRPTSARAPFGAAQLPARAPDGRSRRSAGRRPRAARGARVSSRLGLPGPSCAGDGRPSRREERRLPDRPAIGLLIAAGFAAASAIPLGRPSGPSSASAVSSSHRSACPSESGPFWRSGRCRRSKSRSRRMPHATRCSCSGRSEWPFTATPPTATRASTSLGGRPSRWPSPRPGCSLPRRCSPSRSRATGT